mgnify:CR=1 FL=1
MGKGLDGKNHASRNAHLIGKVDVDPAMKSYADELKAEKGRKLDGTSLAVFSYDALDTETRIVVQQKTSEIKTLMRRTAQDIIDIGGKFAEVRDLLRHNKTGGFEGWLDAEGWKKQFAYNCMAVHVTFANSPNFGQLDIAASALYLLVSPSTPDAAREEAIQRAEAGETITHKAAQTIVAAHKPPAVKPLSDEAWAALAEREEGGEEMPSVPPPDVPEENIDRLLAKLLDLHKTVAWLVRPAFKDTEALDAAVAQGLVEEKVEALPTGATRKSYRLTEAGRARAVGDGKPTVLNRNEADNLKRLVLQFAHRGLYADEHGWTESIRFSYPGIVRTLVEDGLLEEHATAQPAMVRITAQGCGTLGYGRPDWMSRELAEDLRKWVEGDDQPEQSTPDPSPHLTPAITLGATVKTRAGQIGKVVGLSGRAATVNVEGRTVTHYVETLTLAEAEVEATPEAPPAEPLHTYALDNTVKVDGSAIATTIGFPAGSDHQTGKVWVRFTDGLREWVDASRLQPAPDANPFEVGARVRVVVEGVFRKGTVRYLRGEQCGVYLDGSGSTHYYYWGKLERLEEKPAPEREADEDEDVPASSITVIDVPPTPTRTERMSARREAAQAVPTGIYNVIYADPPWAHDNAWVNGAAANHYNVLPFERICSFLADHPFQIADNAVLFMWVTSAFALRAGEVIEAWGFTYKSQRVWIKEMTRPGVGFYVRGQHELLYIATRGSMTPLIDPTPPISSVVVAPVMEHSRKPDEVYADIERAYPGCNYLELFARRSREGWTAYGDQLDGAG